MLTQAQIKPKLRTTFCFTRGGRAWCLRAYLDDIPVNMRAYLDDITVNMRAYLGDITVNMRAYLDDITVNMPDPIRKCFGYSQLWPLRPASARVGPDRICRIPLPASDSVPFFTVQNRPGSDLDGLVRVWPNASGLEASRCAGIIGPGFWEDATGPLPVFHFQTQSRSSTDAQDHIVQNHPDPI